MAYVIATPCIGLKDASCVDVCPVDCIYTTADHDQFFINPDECIDCAACEPVCPVQAIFAMDQVPDDQKPFIEKNAAFFVGADLNDLKDKTRDAPRKLKEVP